MVLKEDVVHKSILTYLKLVLKDCIIFHPANGGSRKGGKIEGARLKAMGVVPGVADIVIVTKGGKCYFIEVKTKSKTSRLSDSQVTFSNTCYDLNVPYGVARDIDEAKHLLLYWGLI